jgi:transcription antitermination factor NusG
MHPWCIAVTWPRYERRVARSLARYGFDFYLPKYKTYHQRVALLFPRYIFAGPAEQWVALRQIYGVSKLLRQGYEQLATVPDAAVAALRAREDHNGFVKLAPPARFRVGQRVRITLGAFTGLSGIYRGGGKFDRVELTLGEVVLPAGNLLSVEPSLPARARRS